MECLSTFFYGHPTPSLRHHTWEKIVRLSLTRRQQPWFLLGDFNEILGNHDKEDEGRLRSGAFFQEFRQMMRICEFTDLQSVGNRIFWVGKRGKH